MNTVCRSWHWDEIRVFLLVVVCLGWHCLFPGVEALAVENEPQIVQITPSDGATGVGSTTPLVIVFDRDMDISVSVFASNSPGLVGNLALDPANLSSQMFGTWGADKRTLTIRPNLTIPLNITVQWTLNPDGVLDFLKIKSATGVPLPKVSGRYSTGVGAPSLGSVNPVDGDEEVSPYALVTFRFSQPMKAIVPIGGGFSAIQWTGAGLDPTRFLYTWSADGRSLVAKYEGGFPLSIRVDWVLNPVGASFRLESQSGQFIPSDTFRGGFSIASMAPCEVEPMNPFLGQFILTKRVNYFQDSELDPRLDLGDIPPFIFSIYLADPLLGSPITSAFIKYPNQQEHLLSVPGEIYYNEEIQTEEEFEQDIPLGSYGLRLTLSGQAEHSILMDFKESDRPTVPKLLSFGALNSVNPASDLVLKWNVFQGATTNDLISFFLSNEMGDVVFFAPNVCTPIELKATDTEVRIPAGTLKANREYSGELLYGRSVYYSTNDLPEMLAAAWWLKGTRFKLKTAGGGSGEVPVNISKWAWTGGHLSLEIQGGMGQAYVVQRSSRLIPTGWLEVFRGVLDGSGLGGFQETPPPEEATWFYRVLLE